MTSTTVNFFVSPSALEPRINTARLERWLKRATPPKPATEKRPIEISTARVDHWFRAQAKAGQWVEQNDNTIGTARVDHWFGPQAQRQLLAQSAPLTGLRAWWKTLRERRALAQADADLQALAFSDSRVLRDLQVARDRAEWRPQH